MEKVAITGVTGDARIARVALIRVKDIPGVAAQISQTLADANIGIQLIIQGIRHDEGNDFSLIISQEDSQHCQEILQGVKSEVGAQEILVDTSVARVSVIGSTVPPGEHRHRSWLSGGDLRSRNHYLGTGRLRYHSNCTGCSTEISRVRDLHGRGRCVHGQSQDRLGRPFLGLY